MQRKPISLNWDEIPSEFHSFLQDAGVFDSSCSKAARVWFLDKDSGFYLKTAPKLPGKRGIADKLLPH